MNMYYDGSVYAAMEMVYPEHNWKGWMFSLSPKGFWEKKDNVRLFVEWCWDTLGIRQLDDWYKVSHLQIQTLGGMLRIIGRFIIIAI